MFSGTNEFMTIFQVLWGFWPLILIGALTGTLERSKKRNLGSNIVFNMLLMWGFFAIIWVLLKATGLETPGYILQQPLNSIIFWIVGFVLIALQVSNSLSNRFRIRQEMSYAASQGDLLRLSPGEFEKVVAETYRAMGNRVEIVAAQVDHGIDIIVHTPNGEKQVVQCKRWKGKVGEPVVRDFYGAMQHENAVEGSIITTGVFTPQARDWAKNKPIRLYEGNEFLRIIQRAQNSKGSIPAPSTSTTIQANNEPRFCPQCGAPLVLRTARQGPHQGEKFYGCSNYPKCRTIIPVEGDKN